MDWRLTPPLLSRQAFTILLLFYLQFKFYTVSLGTIKKKFDFEYPSINFTKCLFVFKTSWKENPYTQWFNYFKDPSSSWYVRHRIMTRQSHEQMLWFIQWFCTFSWFVCRMSSWIFNSNRQSTSGRPL